LNNRYTENTLKQLKRIRRRCMDMRASQQHEIFRPQKQLTNLHQSLLNFNSSQMKNMF